MKLDHTSDKTFQSTLSETTLHIEPRDSIIWNGGFVLVRTEGRTATGCALSLADARDLAEHLLSIPEVAQAKKPLEPISTATALDLMRTRAIDDHGACGDIHGIIDLCLALNGDRPFNPETFSERVESSVVPNLTLDQAETIQSWASKKFGFEPGNGGIRENTLEAINALTRRLLPEHFEPAEPAPFKVGDIVVYTGKYTQYAPDGPTPIMSISESESDSGRWCRVRCKDEKVNGFEENAFRHATPAEIEAFNAANTEEKECAK
jgi:hypothetical protein